MFRTAKFFIGFFVVISCGLQPATVGAQVDRARDQPHSDFISHYNAMVRHAEQKDRVEAIKSAENMARAMNAIYEFVYRAKDSLKKGKLDDLEDDAEELIRAINDFRNAATYLVRNLKDGTKSYSSELSAVKSAKSKFDAEFTELWRNLQTEGKRISAEYAAMKEACSRGCL